MHGAMAAFVLLGFSIPSLAQVYQCKDASGHVNFSDHPCSTSQNGGLIERRRTDAEIYRDRIQAAESNERKYRQQAAEAQRQQVEMQQRLIDQQARSHPEAPAHPSTSQACKEARKELEFVSSIRTTGQDERRMRTNAAISNVNAACGSNTQLIHEPSRPVARPIEFISCDHNLCQDSRGGIYNRGGPGTLIGPSGEVCTGSGTAWNCN